MRDAMCNPLNYKYKLANELALCALTLAVGETVTATCRMFA